MSVRRLFVEKKTAYASGEKSLLADLKNQLKINDIDSVRILARYDVEGLDDNEFKMASDTILSEPMVDKVFTKMPEDMGRVVICELIPGQYDMRADSTVQCIEMLTEGKKVKVATAVIYGINGNISDDEYNKIKKYLINPVEMREGSADEVTSLDMEMPVPADVMVMNGFTSFDDEKIKKLCSELGLAMSIDDAIFVRDYFKSIGREPTMTEIKVLDTYWSDHCRHTTFSTKLENVEIEESIYQHRIEGVWRDYLEARKIVHGEKISRKQVCLMDIATLAAKELKRAGILDNLDESEEINACSIVVDADVDGKNEKWLVMFKNETHNHPTEIEPFGGAATCLGGAIRDPLSGRSFVYQAMRVTGAADPRRSIEETIKGKLPQRVITNKAAAGYSSYGNQIGLATGIVHEVYDDGYAAKRMEIGAVVGAAPQKNVVRMRPEAGDIIVLVGGRTGRDGCGGATGSSKAHTESSLEMCGAEVQKGNPITERKIQRLFRREECSTLIKRCNDFGAGGVSVAVGELADGLDIDLDKVPKKYDGLDGTELAISESQERMAVVIAPENLEKFMELAKEENLEATVIASVTDKGRLTMKWRGKTIVDLERSFIDTNGVMQKTDAFIKAPDGRMINNEFVKADEIEKKWMEVITDLNACTQRGLLERFDSTVGARTALMPLGGKYQRTPVQAMAAYLPVMNGKTNTGTVMSFGFNVDIAKWSPFHGAVYAIGESLARIACAGGDIKKARLSLQEYFGKPGTDKSRWGLPLAALLGAYHAQKMFGAGAIGGKDSMSGTFEKLDVPPTLVSFSLADADMRNVISGEFKNKGDNIYLITTPIDNDDLPAFEIFKDNCEMIYKNITSGNIKAAYTVQNGGIAETVAKMAFGNMLGAELDSNVDKDMLFGKMPCSFIVEAEKLEGKYVSHIGNVIDNGMLSACGVKINLENAYRASENVLEGVFPVKSDNTLENSQICELSYTHREQIMPKVKILKPRVLIPVFPGTNCEYESAKAFEKFGAEVNTVIIKNINPGDIDYTLKMLENEIKKSQIIMFPGGFSAGDEPDGSGKFIATTFRSPRLKDAVSYMLDKNDGLILGICNGFQTLIKLGLLPYGEIRDMSETAPTLTFNDIGRHQSRIVRTRIASVKSPWFAGVNVGDIISVAISHGEGKFVCPENFDELVKNGQIATQYVDMDGKATMDIDYNPNGSFFAVEGITSLDGRILGKMGHNERCADGLLKNVEGNYDSKIFESGVKYFK